ncbi:uncharacterized protein LOC101858812 [Aplysia californica]|uniref:Uncharacterized protein LOC101858812 n=1 Tax=Aplysia californica TaxID=6500 RepID=A0ABM0K5A7_APLCA|nr:uncharacterized protein LOC101858812 [Aplysia californica]
MDSSRLKTPLRRLLASNSQASTDDDSELSPLAIGILIGGSILFIIILILFIVWLLRINGKICKKNKAPSNVPPPVVHNLDMAGFNFEQEDALQTPSSGDAAVVRERAQDTEQELGKSHFSVYIDNVGTFKDVDSQPQPQQVRDCNDDYTLANDVSDSDGTAGNAKVVERWKTHESIPNEYSLATTQQDDLYVDLKDESNTDLITKSTAEDTATNEGNNENVYEDVHHPDGHLYFELERGGDSKESAVRESLEVKDVHENIHYDVSQEVPNLRPEVSREIREENAESLVGGSDYFVLEKCADSDDDDETQNTPSVAVASTDKGSEEHDEDPSAIYDNNADVKKDLPTVGTESPQSSPKEETTNAETEQSDDSESEQEDFSFKDYSTETTFI